jgi:hypothetical protein
VANTIDLVTDWKARLRSRLFTQFRSAASWVAWCDNVLGPQFDDLEQAGQTLLTLLDIDESEGVQLDTIGRVVGQSRNGVDDDTYRLYLSARILANKSTGTVEDIFKVMRALFGQTETLPTYQGGWVKQFAIRIGKVLTRAEALIATDFLADSKEAGARGILEWQESPSSLLFAFSDIAILTASVSAGLNAAVQVNSTSGFATSGVGTIDPGTAIADSFPWDTRGDTTLSNGSPYSIFNNHNISAQVWPSTGQIKSALGFDQGVFTGAKQA